MANWLRASCADRREKRVWFPAEPPAEQAEEAGSLFPYYLPWGCPHPPPPQAIKGKSGSQRDLDKALSIIHTSVLKLQSFPDKTCVPL